MHRCRNIKIQAVSAAWYSGIDLLISHNDPALVDKGKISIVRPQGLTFETIDDPLIIIEPSLKISREAAQQLMDELWHCGIRPSNGIGNAGQLAATEKHLADMREIVRKRLGIDFK